MAQKKAQNSKNDSLSTSKKIGIGVGLTAAAVTAAGAYFLYGSKNAAKNRKSVKSWVLKAKAEVLEKIEDAKEMTREEYESLIDTVANTYATLKNATKSDILEFRKEMKAHWDAIEKETSAAKKTHSKIASKKPAKKAATQKKAAKKASK